MFLVFSDIFIAIHRIIVLVNLDKIRNLKLIIFKYKKTIIIFKHTKKCHINGINR